MDCSNRVVRSQVGHSACAPLQRVNCTFSSSSHVPPPSLPPPLNTYPAGKRVTVTGEVVDYDIGPVDFGEPGTNGQHSFFQLLHMGQVRERYMQRHALKEYSAADVILEGSESRRQVHVTVCLHAASLNAVP